MAAGLMLTPYHAKYFAHDLTLRNEVTEYIRYTERRAITRPFSPDDNEHSLYEAVSVFLQRPYSYALPQRQRHLTALILRKLLASSSLAIAATLDALRIRLESLRNEQAQSDPELAESLIDAEELDDELLDEILGEDEETATTVTAPATIDREKIQEEIDTLRWLGNWARIRLHAKKVALDRLDQSAKGAPIKSAK